MPPTIEQIAEFVAETEKGLSKFDLDAMAMRGRLPMLRGIISLLEQTTFEEDRQGIKQQLNELESLAEDCRNCIERRLQINR
ncbi:MAG: hypothetical protein ACYTFK_11195 [Planctomycetota bacterium]|jgi:hypothetical protein